MFQAEKLSSNLTNVNLRLYVLCFCNYVVRIITSNFMAMRVIWDKSPEVLYKIVCNLPRTSREIQFGKITREIYPNSPTI